MSTPILSVAPAGTWNLDPVPPIADPYGNERVGLSLATKIDRTDFGVDWNHPLPSGEPSLANEVTILAELQFVKPEVEPGE